MDTPMEILDTTARSYHARELPLDEWIRRQHELPYPPGAIEPSDGKVMVVVETDQGVIVGSWCAMNVIVLEGAHIDEAHRHGPVVKYLLGEMVKSLLEAGIPGAMTVVHDPTVEKLALRIGFQHVPGSVYQLDLRPQESR